MIERRLDTDARRDEPWYHNGWVWLILAIPAATIAACMLTIYLAVTNPDERVSDPPAPTAGRISP